MSTGKFELVSSERDVSQLCRELQGDECLSFSHPLELPDNTVIVAVYGNKPRNEYERVCIHLYKDFLSYSLRSILDAVTCPVVVHGLKSFLGYFARAHELTVDHERLRCSRLLAYLYDPPEKSEDESERDLTLESLVRRYLREVYPLWGEWLRGRSYPDALYQRLWEDARYTHRLWYWLTSKLQKEPLARVLDCYHDIELPMVRILLDMELRGIRVDCDGAKAILERIRSSLTVVEAAIGEQVGHLVNPNSPHQVRGFLGGVLGEPFTLAVDDESLRHLVDLHPSVALMLEYRELSRTARFFEMAATCMDGRIYPTYHQCRIATGRVSATDPAVQNIRRDLREAHLLPEQEHYLVEADYSQAEARLLAFFSGDPTLGEIFRSDDADVFEETATRYRDRMRGRERELTRAEAKTLFYSVTYGISPAGLAKQLGVEENTAQGMIVWFKRQLFPGVGAFVDSLRGGLVRQERKNRCLFTPWGRLRRFDRRLISLRDNQSPDRIREPERDPEVRRALNFLLQGTVADLIKQVQIRLHTYLHEAGMESRVMLNLHDGLYLSVAPSEYETVKPLVIDIMESEEFGATIESVVKGVENSTARVPLKAKAKVLQEPTD